MGKKLFDLTKMFARRPFSVALFNVFQLYAGSRCHPFKSFKKPHSIGLFPCNGSFQQFFQGRFQAFFVGRRLKGGLNVAEKRWKWMKSFHLAGYKRVRSV